jgi:hypothetical protein
MMMMKNGNILSFATGIISTISVIFLFSAISDTLQSTWAQLPGNFTFEYNYTKYDNCTPQCQNIRVAYNSSGNNATIVNHQLQGDLVTNRVLNEQEENMLSEIIMRLYEQTTPLVFR